MGSYPLSLEDRFHAVKLVNTQLRHDLVIAKDKTNLQRLLKEDAQKTYNLQKIKNKGLTDRIRRLELQVTKLKTEQS